MIGAVAGPGAGDEEAQPTVLGNGGRGQGGKCSGASDGYRTDLHGIPLCAPDDEPG